MGLGHKSLQQTTNKSSLLKRAYKYFEGVKAEFLRVQWTRREDIKTYTKAILISTFVFGMLIYFADLIIRQCVHGLDTIFQWIFG